MHSISSTPGPRRTQRENTNNHPKNQPSLCASVPSLETVVPPRAKQWCYCLEPLCLLLRAIAPSARSSGATVQSCCAFRAKVAGAQSANNQTVRATDGYCFYTRQLYQKIDNKAVKRHALQVSCKLSQVNRIYVAGLRFLPELRRKTITRDVGRRRSKNICRPATQKATNCDGKATTCDAKGTDLRRKGNELRRKKHRPTTQKAPNRKTVEQCGTLFAGNRGNLLYL